MLEEHLAYIRVWIRMGGGGEGGGGLEFSN